MEININKKLLKKMLLVAGVSLVLSGCGRDTTPDYIPFSDTQTNDDANSDSDYDDSYDEDYDDSYDEDSEKEKSEDESVSDNSEQVDSGNHEMKEISISSSAELNGYFSDTVDFSDVRDAIYDNSNLRQQERKYYLELIQRLEEKAPTVDLRCLYENFKLLVLEKKEKPENSRKLASFLPKEHKINIFQDEKYNYTHEGLHMINNLYLPLEDKNVILNRRFSFDQYNSVSWLEEGFTAWFNAYLFGDVPDYPIQRSDMNIIKYILNLTDEEFIQMCTGGNYTSIIKCLGQYLKEEEITAWMDISKMDISQQEKNDSIDFSKINKKYSFLLKACIASKGGMVGSDELYQIMTLLSNSYNKYSNVSKTEKMTMHNEFMGKLKDRLDYTNNDIQILDMKGEPIEFCDIDQMYFILMENENVIFAEKYLDSEANERYYANASYTAKANDIVVSINELINYEAEYRDCYTVSELATIYSEYSREYEVENYSGAYQKTP